MAAARKYCVLGLAVATIACCGGTQRTQRASHQPDDLCLPDQRADLPAALTKSRHIDDTSTTDIEVPNRDWDKLLQGGPAQLLARIEVEAVTEAGNFVGWRIHRLPGSASDWGFVVGDIILRINGTKLARPEHLTRLWKQLRDSKAITVEFARSGAVLEMRFLLSPAPGSTTVPKAE